MYENHKGEKYTPIEGPVMFQLDKLKASYGTWAALADSVGVKRRYLRYIRRGRRKTISMSLLDRILSLSNSTASVDDFAWYDPEELVVMGIWKAVPDGRQLSDVHYSSPKFSESQNPSS